MSTPLIIGIVVTSAVFTICFAIMLLALWRAPLAVEDTEGFHVVERMPEGEFESDEE